MLASASFWIDARRGSLRLVPALPPLFELLEVTLIEALKVPTDHATLLRRFKGAARPDGDLLLAASHRAFELAAPRISAAQLAQDMEQSNRVWQWLQLATGVLTTLGHQSAPSPLASRAYFSPGMACRDAIFDAIDGASRTLDVCVFTITDDHLAKALAAAHRRGVAIRIVTDNDKGRDLGSDIERLEHLGIPVRIDRTEYHMHHKFAIVDKRMLLNGSYNWTRGAFSYNQENVVVCYDSALLVAFQRTFDELWQQFYS